MYHFTFLRHTLVIVKRRPHAFCESTHSGGGEHYCTHPRTNKGHHPLKRVSQESPLYGILFRASRTLLFPFLSGVPRFIKDRSKLLLFSFSSWVVVCIMSGIARSRLAEERKGES